MELPLAYVRRTVERIIESDPTIKIGLQRGIINSRALSRYMLENCAIDSTQDAVVGVLRRYPLERGRNDNGRLALKDCNIIMRGGMAYLTLENSSDVMKRVSEFAGTIRSTRGENFKAVVGSNSVRVIASQGAVDAFKQTFPSKDIIGHSTALAEICIVLPSRTERLGEIATSIMAQLTLNRIRMVGLMVCPPEDIILVAEGDAPRALDALQQMLRDDTTFRNGEIHAGPLENSATRRKWPDGMVQRILPFLLDQLRYFLLLARQ